MYIMPARKKSVWTIARARQQLSTLIESAAREPQAVYRRSKLVAAVVSPGVYQRTARDREAAAQPKLSDALAELRTICQQEAYRLPLSRRRDRVHPGASRR